MVEENPGLPNGLTLGELIEQYQTDPVSGWHNLRFATRRNQQTVLRRWAAQYGDSDHWLAASAGP